MGQAGSGRAEANPEGCEPSLLGPFLSAQAARITQWMPMQSTNRKYFIISEDTKYFPYFRLCWSDGGQRLELGVRRAWAGDNVTICALYVFSWSPDQFAWDLFLCHPLSSSLAGGEGSSATPNVIINHYHQSSTVNTLLSSSLKLFPYFKICKIYVTYFSSFSFVHCCFLGGNFYP